MDSRVDHKIILQEIRNGNIRPEKYGDYWTPEERELLSRLFDEGVGISEISIILKRNEASVMQQLQVMGKFQISTPARTRHSSCSKHRCEDCTLTGDSLPEYCLKRKIECGG